MSYKSSLALAAVVSLITIAAWTRTESGHETTRRLLANYATNPVRTTTVGNLCAGKNRQTLIDSAAASQSATYKSQLAQQIPISGNALFVDLVVNKNQSAAMNMITSNITGLAIFVGVFFIGLILMGFITPFLCCCCCCPGCCPSKCCQKADDEQYTKCELYWPSITLMLALLLAIGSSAYGFSQASGVATGVTNMACSVAILTDDMLNGNVTNNGSNFFVGMETLSIQLGQVNTNLSIINNSLSSLTNSVGTNMSTILAAATQALTDISNIPTGSVNGTMPAFSYGTPLNSLANTSSIPSTFPNTLGSTSGGGSGVVGALYSAISGVQSVLNTIATSAGAFVNSTGSFGSAVITAQSSIGNFVSTIKSGDTSLGNALSSGTSLAPTITMVVQAFYGVIIGFAVLALLGMLLMTFCDKYRCRHLMYFACIFLFLIGLIGFLISSLFSIFTPVLYLGCDFLTTSFSTNFGTFITDTTTLNYVTTCLATQSGDIISQIAGIGSVTNLSTAFTSISNFSGTSQASNITTMLNNMTDIVAGYGIGRYADITDQTSLSLLGSIANRSGYACSAPLFASDSWVPSTFGNQTYAPCSITGGNTGTQAACASNFNNGAGTCNGCMDTYQLFFNNGTGPTVTASLAGRYANANCNQFNLDLGNIWNNFYKIKMTQIGAPIQASSTNTINGTAVYSRMKTAQASSTQVINYVSSNITSLFNATSIAVSGLTSLLDPTYGLIGGLNCQLFGEDFNRILSTLCVSMFNAMYINRLTIGIACWGILFSLCCIVCSGVRHYKHSERKDKISDAFKGGNTFDQGTKQSFKGDY